jgi:hypothetical protein
LVAITPSRPLEVEQRVLELCIDHVAVRDDKPVDLVDKLGDKLPETNKCLEALAIFAPGTIVPI